MEVQAGSEGRSAQHTASHREEVWGEQWMAAAHGWTVAGLLWDVWLAENTGQAVPMYLHIPADPSAMITESRQPMLG